MFKNNGIEVFSYVIQVVGMIRALFKASDKGRTPGR
jgi:hypothetical protein